MKWSPKQGSNNQDRTEHSYLGSAKSALVHTTSQAAKILFCFVCTGMFLSGDDDRLKSTVASISPEKLLAKVDRTASAISVRILDQDFLGSGFIVQQSDQDYLVITNQHVLRAGEAPYTVETVDGKTYSAKVVTDMSALDYQYDLAVLKFTADIPYQTAKVGNSFNLDVGDRVFAAGFPYQDSLSATPDLFPASRLDRQALALKSGRVAIVLDRALEEGYQIGYTNDVKKGMSGGALFNDRAEVVGVNGKHAYPLWESPEIYQDGSEPCSALQELITRSSLAIPIEKSIEVATPLKSLKPDSVELEYPTKSRSRTAEKAPVVARMQKIAESTKKQCRQERAVLENQ
ncbi:MAG: serine protease [Cyanobacteria bacterium J06623_7]